MGAGNTNTSGQRKNNHSFQHRNLILLGQLKAISNGLATESTLISVLNALVAHQDMEILLVRDTGNSDLVVQQIREYDETTQTWSTSYQKVDGSPYVPPELVGPLEYLDPSAVLNLMLAELLDQGLTLDAIQTEQLAQGLSLDSLVTNTTGLSTEVTLAALLTAFNSEDFAQEATSQLINSNIVLGNLTLNGIKTQTDLLNFIATALEVNVTSSALPTGAATEATQILNNTALGSILAQLDVDLSTRATEATLLLVKAVLDTIKVDTANLDVTLSSRLNTLGRKAETASAPVVLSDEDFASLEAIRVAVQNLDVDVDGIATEVTLAALLTAFNNEDFATQTTLAAVAADLALIYTNLQLNTISVANIDTKLTPQARVHNTLSANAVGVIPAGSMSGSVLNAGNAAGTWNGISIPAGVSIPWGAIGNRDTYGAIAYDGTGTTLIIEYTT